MPVSRCAGGVLALLLGLAVPFAARGDDPPYKPTIEEASDEGEKAIARFRVPAGLKVQLFAAEPLMAHPVAIAQDERGRWFVAETFRHSDGVTDTRGHMNWLVDDIASRSVADRLAMYQKYLTSEEQASYSVHHDRLRLVEDRDGDGRAETATVFADGFNKPESGLGAGVLARRGDVYYTCIPDLWLLRDKDGDGKADERTSLQTGYGVRVQFIGHDLHGLIIGPDGRLYFTVGDRGMNVTTVDGKTLAWPDSGAVLRCELDGSNLEIIHVGLRNPQELAFDDLGNLFTVDNNSDGGDQARLVWVVPGGDSGWRAGYQYLTRPTQRGPWNAEKMWQPQNDVQPAFLVPPLANFTDGPSGLAYNPGTALRPEDRGRFYIADFRGSSGDSGVRSFAVRPKGAAFELADEKQFVWGLEATDVAFGNDGAMYISDWGEGWSKTGKGRIYRVFDPASEHGEATEATRQIIAEGMSKREFSDVIKLLDHDDQRVRLEAQWELAESFRTNRGMPVQEIKNVKDLTRVFKPLFDLISGTGTPAPSLQARTHAIWAMAQGERKKSEGRYSPVWSLLMKDRSAVIRELAIRTMADVLVDSPRAADAEINDLVIKAMTDSEPRIRFYGALAAGKLGKEMFLSQLRTLIADNADTDAYLRHAGVMGLAGVARKNLEAVVALASDDSASVRLAVLLTLRRLQSPEVGRFLSDKEPRIVLEAARAIYDTAIDGALPQLADLTVDKNTPTPLLRRVLQARARLGRAEDAQSLARLAAADGMTSATRVDALDTLANWGEAPQLDAITGLYRPIKERDAGDASAALTQVGDGLIRSDSELVSQAALKAAAKLHVSELAAAALDVFAQTDRSSNTRVEAIKALDVLGHNRLGGVARNSVKDRDRRVRAEALAILARIEPAEALKVLADVLQSGNVEERQRAFATLAGIKLPEADAQLLTWLEKMSANEVAPEIKLDLLEAAAQRNDDKVKQQLAQYEASLNKNDPLAAFEVALQGGRTSRGEQVFKERSDLSCLRCHKVRGEGGEVGPDLTGIGGKKDRRYLLESIVTPNHQIAEGFETRVLALADGTLVAGIVKKSDDKALSLMTPEGRVLEVPRTDVEEEKRGDSAMPADLVQKMSRTELRDLVEYLSSLKEGGNVDRR